MDTEINSCIEELRALARERGWARTAGDAETLLSGALSVGVLIAAPTDVDATSLRLWVAQALPSHSIRVESLRSLQSDPLPVLQSDRLIVILECGRLMDAEEVDVIAGLVSMRPDNTFAYALTRADRITSDDDLDLVQRGFWRLLVPDPKPEWNGQDIHPFHAYLWSAEPPAGAVEARVRTDQQALTRWLSGPECGTRELHRQQGLYLLGLAWEEAQVQASGSLESAGIEEFAVRNALESVIELRRRFNRHLDADALAVEGELTVSLQTLEQNLVVDLPRYLRSHLDTLHGDLDGSQLRAMLSEYIRQGAERWQLDMQQTLSARGQEISHEAQMLFHGINWTLINAIVRGTGSEQTFPDSLTRTLASSREFQSVRNSGFAAPDVSQYRGPAGFGATLRIAAAGSIAGGIALFLLGLGPIGIISAGAAGALGGGVIHRHYQNRLSQQEAESVCQQAISSVLREAVAQVRQQTRETFTPIRGRFNQEMKFLEDLLDHTLQEARRADNSPASANPTPAQNPDNSSDLAWLHLVRGRLLARDDQPTPPAIP